MKWDAEGIDFGEIIKEPNWLGGYQKTDIVKRAKAFKYTFVPMYVKKIKECEEVKNYNLAREHYMDFRKRFKKFLRVVVSLEHAKAYYIMQDAAIDFIKKIGVPIKEHTELIRV